MMVRRIFEWRPISTPSIRIDSSMSEYEWMRTRGWRTQRLSVPPEMMTPSETSESVAMPMRCDFESAKTNFAGGRFIGAETIGHWLLYRLNAGVTLTRSRHAAKYESIVPTSRQYPRLFSASPGMKFFAKSYASTFMRGYMSGMISLPK